MHNTCAKTLNSVPKKEVVNIKLKYKEGWTPEQRAQADAKVKALSEAFTYKKSNTKRINVRKKYKDEFGQDSIPANHDIDHIVDLQLGGTNDISNLAPLDRSVNRSLGVQIKNAIKDYKDGTIFGEFTIE